MLIAARTICLHSAYLAWVWGSIAKTVTPRSVALYSSRGSEAISTIVLMRVAVLVSEAVLLAVVLALCCALKAQSSHNTAVLRGQDHVRQQPRRFWAAVSVAGARAASSMHVACALIDHGHTQHNSIALLCALIWAILACHSFQPGVGPYDLLAAGVFVVSLNFKQIALYYALPVFAVHLLRCSAETSWMQKLRRFLSTGLVVLVSQVALVLPLCTGSRSCSAEALQVLTRVFPTSRGIFEDKVANMWCILEPLFKVQQHLQAGSVHPSAILGASTLCTLVLCAPGLWLVFTRLNNFTKTLRPSAAMLACAISGLGFFLCSVQVHEKSILFPLFAGEAAEWTAGRYAGPKLQSAIAWFRLHAIVSLVPLLVRDGVSLGTCAIIALVLLGQGSLRKAAATRCCFHVLLHTCLLVGQVFSVFGHLGGASPTHLPHLYLLGLSAASFTAFLAIWLQLVLVLSSSTTEQL